MSNTNTEMMNNIWKYDFFAKELSIGDKVLFIDKTEFKHGEVIDILEKFIKIKWTHHSGLDKIFKRHAMNIVKMDSGNVRTLGDEMGEYIRNNSQ